MCVLMRRYYDATTISLRQELVNEECSLHERHPIASSRQPDHQLYDMVSQCMAFCATDVTVLLAHYQIDALELCGCWMVLKRVDR